jgi:hypothetical protein
MDADRLASAIVASLARREQDLPYQMDGLLVELDDDVLVAAGVRYVRTPAGVKRYGLPIGSPIGSYLRKSRIDSRVEGKTSPTLLTAAEFESRVPIAQRLYRGVGSSGGAAATREGKLGNGDYGKGQYFGREIATAQVYARQSGGLKNGLVLRAAIKDSANIKKPPERVARKGSRGIDEWAESNGIDVVDLDQYQVIRNPGVLMMDEHDYSLDESVVLYYRAHGYTLPENYQDVKLPGDIPEAS